MPETALQVAAGAGLEEYFAATRPPYSHYVNKVIERVLPFTRVVKNLKGGKYPTHMNYVPPTAKFVVQATEEYPDEYFWWLKTFNRNNLAIENVYWGLNGIETVQLFEYQGTRVSRIITHHNTAVYVDESTWELRHGPVEQSPENVWLVHNSKRGTIEYGPKEVSRSALFTHTDSYMIVDREKDIEHAVAPIVVFNIVELDGGRVALKSGVMFLSAEINGKIGLFARACLPWENFQLRSSDALACRKPPPRFQARIPVDPKSRPAFRASKTTKNTK